MPKPVYGFHPIDRDEFYENMNFRLSRPEIEGKTTDQIPSAILYFMGVDQKTGMPENDRRALHFNQAIVCGQALVDIESCDKFQEQPGLYIVSFSGNAPTASGIARTDFQALIDQRGSIQSSENLTIAAGYFTDLSPDPNLSRESLDRLILEVEDWSFNS